MRNQLSVRNSRFNGNAAEEGGALALALDDAHIENSSFSGNLAWRAGGAIVTWRGDISISSSTFYNNIANTAGAVYVDGGIVTLTHLTMLNNAATGGTGAGLRKFKGIASLRNSIIAGGAGEGLSVLAGWRRMPAHLSKTGHVTRNSAATQNLSVSRAASPTIAPRDDSPAINTAYRTVLPRPRPNRQGASTGRRLRYRRD